MERENKSDFFLIRDRTDKFLAARTGQAENVIDAMSRRHFEIGL
jgi:hypothetical protein